MASNSDFFSFCTTLKPVELKALGELSSVKHLEEGITIFSSGDPADALYILNRGAVAVIHEDPRYSDRADVSYLSRGDMFGEIDVLTETPRRNAIRTCEAVSLQCFRKDDFPEIIRRVPVFFHFLAQRLALRFVQITDLAFVQSHCLELSGSLRNFDLVTIYQTIVNSSQTGELALFNEGGEAIAIFFFSDGRPQHAQYYSLSGEEALFQLFLHEEMKGTFSFSIMEKPSEDEMRQIEINRSSNDLLFTALQYRDEFKELIRIIPDPTLMLHPLATQLDWPNDGSELAGYRPIAERIWESIQHEPISVDDLFQNLMVCELKLYRVIQHLEETGQVAVQGEPGSSRMIA